MSEFATLATAYAQSLQEIQHETKRPRRKRSRSGTQLAPQTHAQQQQQHKQSRLERSLSTTAQYLSDFTAAAYRERDEKYQPGHGVKTESGADHWVEMMSLCQDRFKDRTLISKAELQREHKSVLGKVLNATTEDGSPTGLFVRADDSDHALALATLGLLMIDWQRAGSVPDTRGSTAQATAGFSYRATDSVDKFELLLQAVQDETYRHVEAMSRACTLGEKVGAVGAYLSNVATAYSLLRDELDGGGSTINTVDSWGERFAQCAIELEDPETFARNTPQNFTNTMSMSRGMGWRWQCWDWLWTLHRAGLESTVDVMSLFPSTPGRIKSRQPSALTAAVLNSLLSVRTS